MQFGFVTAKYFNFNLRNPRQAYTVSAPQEEKQSKNLTSRDMEIIASDIFPKADLDSD